MLSGAVRRAERVSLRSRSIPTIGTHPRVPLSSEINPMRIPWHDERDLLRPAPAFELRLPRKSLVDIIVRLPVQQSSDLVHSSEALEMVELVLENTLVQIAAEPDVERAGETAHDVDAIVTAIARHAAILS